jgi:hypothetical protein
MSEIDKGHVIGSRGLTCTVCRDAVWLAALDLAARHPDRRWSELIYEVASQAESDQDRVDADALNVGIYYVPGQIRCRGEGDLHR